jgi:uncharacterized protein YggU (UPF0235/DUF167 family)
MAQATTRFSIRVKPGARSDGVGGTWGEAGTLEVSVRAKAIDGRANAAVLELLATVLKLRKRQLRIVVGATHRTKVVEVTDPPADLEQRLERWRAR